MRGAITLLVVVLTRNPGACARTAHSQRLFLSLLAALLHSCAPLALLRPCAAGVRAAGGGQPAADEPGRRFMTWFTKLGGTTRSIELAAFPGSGRGVRATRPLTRGTVVAEIPMDIVVTLSTVAYDPSLRDLGPLILTPKVAAQLGHTDVDPNAHQQLARPKTDAFSVWVAMQRKRGKDSPGEPWVGLFPTDDAIGDPLAWPQHAQAWLQASPLRKKLEHKNEMLAETVTVLHRELGY